VVGNEFGCDVVVKVSLHLVAYGFSFVSETLSAFRRRDYAFYDNVEFSFYCHVVNVAHAARNLRDEDDFV